MARTVNTENIESKTRFWGNFEVFDFFFMFAFLAVNIALKDSVHPSLRIPYYIFAVLMGLFLTKKNNLTRRNFESIYFLIKKDIYTYKPLIERSEKNDEETEREYK